MTKLPEIKFTKWLQKLSQIDTTQPVTLIHVSRTRITRLSGAFLRYDTKFTGDRGYYNLEGLEEIVLLIFCDCNGMCFSTLRPFKPEKLSYYQSKIDQPFRVVVREPVINSPHYRLALGLE